MLIKKAKKKRKCNILKDTMDKIYSVVKIANIRC